MEKLWNKKNWQKVMEFCDWSSNYTNFAPELYHICAFFADIKKFSISLQSLYFPAFSAKCRECKI